MGCRVQGLGIRAEGLGSRVQDFGVRGNSDPVEAPYHSTAPNVRFTDTKFWKHLEIAQTRHSNLCPRHAEASGDCANTYSDLCLRHVQKLSCPWQPYKYPGYP